MANPVSTKRWVLVRGVLHRVQSEFPTERLGLTPTQVDQRTLRTAADTGHARWPRPAQQVQDHGLGPVVGRVTGEDARWQHAIAGLPRPGLQVGPWRNLHALGPEPSAQPSCHLGNHQRLNF